MARVVRRAAAARSAPSSVARRRARKHKVIMEAITQEKKKLRSVICFEAQAPSGFTFIPAGNPLLTTSCKERCRKDGLQVFAVSTTPHMGTHNLSQHVHRIGYHFPSAVVAAVCSELGLYLTSAGKAVPFHSLGSLQKNSPEKTDVDQITINTEARDAIRDLFPNIPDNDLNQIIKTAFQKGQRKVGTASALPLARRAQLAVVAHIRHVYTDYDRLLKQKSFHEARSEVEHLTLNKVIAWRGDDENGQTALEDVFREVIVISDDDDSELEEDEVMEVNMRDRGVELLPETGRIHQVETRPVRATPMSYHNPAREHSEEASAELRIVARAPAQSSINRRGFSRYQAWNRALNRYRAEATATQPVPVGGAQFAERQGRADINRPVTIHRIPEPPASASVDKVPTSGSGNRFVRGHGQQASSFGPAESRPGNILPGPHGRRFQMEFEPNVTHERSTARSVTLTLQKPPRAQHLSTRVYPSTRSARIADTNQQPMSSHGCPEGCLPPSVNRKIAPGLSHNPDGFHLEQKAETNSRSDCSEPFIPRAVSHREEPIPSIETTETTALTEKRPAEGRLVHLTQGMSLRSITPIHTQGETSRHVLTTGTEDSENPKTKRRRLAHPEPNNNPAYHGRNSRTGEESGFTGLQRIHCQEETRGSQPHALNRLHLRRDHSPHMQHAPALIYPLQRNAPAEGFPASSSARPIPDRPHLHESHATYPTATQPGFVNHSRIVHFTDRTAGPPAGATRAEIRPIYFSDRSPGFDRPRPARMEGYMPELRSYSNADHDVVYTAPAHGRQYANGFVRAVDVREARATALDPPPPPVRDRQLFHVEADRTQPAGAWTSDSQVLYDSSRATGFVENRHTRSPHLLLASSEQAVQPNHTSPREVHSKPSGAPRDRRPGNGVNAPRRYHDPRAFQMAESNRPIYVQRVEQRLPPQHPVPERRPVIIVD
ncbi:Uncharacterized protein PECH_007068 [Penicillium ucsense]|uniref:DUF2293 domain-containing protein n=1 Tax=Penicillium ucsense TaxID=2839758 RepID=A0A8J8WG19_9EURO|nr:Uncharacterized protein PECM_007919 [Penicillium ucsense]KAF7735183.1 Uncharacterized protein PECH_007068 [Penicillium ucsense]